MAVERPEGYCYKSDFRKMTGLGYDAIDVGLCQAPKQYTPRGYLYDVRAGLVALLRHCERMEREARAKQAACRRAGSVTYERIADGWGKKAERIRGMMEDRG